MAEILVFIENKNEIDAIEQYDLKDAIDFVSKDVYDDLQNPVDIQMRASIAKRRKLCTSMIRLSLTEQYVIENSANQS